MTIETSTIVIDDDELSDIHQLTDIELIKQSLKQIELEEEQLEKEITLKMNNKENFFKSLKHDLEKSAKPNLDLLDNQIKDLKSIIDETYEFGWNPLQRLIYFNQQQNSVNDTLTQLRNTKNLKIYQEELKLGIENSDLNQSIQSINNYLNTDIDTLKKGYFGRYFKNADHFNMERFESFRQEMIETLKTKYQEGVETNNKELVLDQIKKLPKLGEPELAIKLLNDYITKPLLNQEKSDSSKPILQLKQLLETLAANVTEYQEWIGDHFGSGWFLSWMNQLIEVVNPICLQIFQDFKQANDWENKIQKIHTSSRLTVNLNSKTTSSYHPNPNNLEAELDIKELDRLLDELTFMCQKIRLFEFLVLNKIMEEKLSIESEKSLARHHYSCPIPLVESCLENLLTYGSDDIRLFPQFREIIMNQYPLIEKFYFTDTIKQAIEMDEYEEGNGTSSSVDDSFYLIKKGSFRSLTNCHLETFQQSISIYKEVLTKVVLPSFDPKPVSNSSGNANVTTLKNTLISINNTGTSQKYVNTLITELQSVAHKILATFPSSQKLEFDTSILSLNEVETRFKRSHQNLFDRLITKSLTPKLTNFMQVLSNESDYVIQNEEDLHLLSTIELKFKSRLQPFLKPYQSNLIEYNFKLLIEKLSEIISNQFEIEFILKNKFNWFGAQKLDEDLRLIIQFLSSQTEVYVKDYFRIPLTIVDILIQEDIEHVRDALPQDLIIDEYTTTQSNNSNKVTLEILASWMKLRQDWDINQIEDFIISLSPQLDTKPNLNPQ